MNSYQIESKSGVVYGVYQGATPEAAFRAMVEDGGAGTNTSGEPTEGLAGDWIITPADLVVIEYMPVALRASHVKAENRGVWPHNGAERVAATRSQAEGIRGHEWARVVNGEDPADYDLKPYLDVDA